MLVITVIPATQFKTVPWKNGLGHTTELAINDGGNLDGFDWRLSIASVVSNGEFSNFSGYQRNLVLIEGSGLTLDHQNGDIDSLINLLDIARFNGGCKTIGTLSNDAIKDFNIITNEETVNVEVACYREQQHLVIKPTKTRFCFAYSLTDDICIEGANKTKSLIAVGDLVKLSAAKEELTEQQLTYGLTGKNIILVQLTPK